MIVRPGEPTAEGAGQVGSSRSAGAADSAAAEVSSTRRILVDDCGVKGERASRSTSTFAIERAQTPGDRPAFFQAVSRRTKAARARGSAASQASNSTCKASVDEAAVLLDEPVGSLCFDVSRGRHTRGSHCRCIDRVGWGRHLFGRKASEPPLSLPVSPAGRHSPCHSSRTP